MRILDVPLTRILGADGVVPPKGLVQSIRAVGLLHPILVAPVYASGDYTVIAGRKRVAAARELGWATIPVQVSAHHVRDLLPLHENLHRAPSPALEARIIGDLVGQGMSQREVAHALGISQAQVSQRLALLTLVPKALDMLERGEMGASLARALAKLPFQEQQDLLAGEMVTLAQVQACRRQRKLEALADLPLPAPLRPQPPPEAPHEEGYWEVSIGVSPEQMQILTRWAEHNGRSVDEMMQVLLHVAVGAATMDLTWHATGENPEDLGPMLQGFIDRMMAKRDIEEEP